VGEGRRDAGRAHDGQRPSHAAQAAAQPSADPAAWGGPFFVLFLAQHSACIRTMDRMKRHRRWWQVWRPRTGGIAPRDFHDTYLVELERFWSLDESGLRVFGLEDAGFGESLWESFVVARTLFRLTNGGVLMDRDTRP
jgi:hypothetical protein